MQMLNLKESLHTVKLIASNGKKQDERIHQVGCSGIHHYLNEGNGDTTILTNLVHAMPKSSRGNALKYWITKNCNVKWNAKAFGGQGGYVKAIKGEPASGNLEAAIAEPFWIKPDNEAREFKGYSREAEVANFIKRLKAKEAKLGEQAGYDESKVSLEVTEASISALLELTDFEVVVSA